MGVLIFSEILSETFLIRIIIHRVITINIPRYSSKVAITIIRF